MSSEPDDKCLTLIPQIHEGYKNSVSAAKGFFEYALECGDLLNRAKETVGKGKWLEWRATHCSFIKQRTASDYMRLATAKADGTLNQQALDKLAADGELSIRGAIALLPKRTRTPSENTPPEPNKNGDETPVVSPNAAGAIQSAQASPDLEELLPTVGPDEVFKVIREKWTLEELAKLARSIDDFLNPPKLEAAA